MENNLKKQLQDFIESHKSAAEAVNELREEIHKHSPCSGEPVDNVKLVPLEEVEPNNYNPNSVASVEMQLLLKSINADGYTQPIVVIYNDERKKYIIVDGFHRYYVMKQNQELRERTSGLLPVTVIKKDIAERMASTVRHNRARGKHAISGMSNLVFKMLDSGMQDEDVCNELGMEPEELLRLKHITGFSKLFKDVEYKKEWMTRSQIQIRKAHKEGGSHV